MFKPISLTFWIICFVLANISFSSQGISVTETPLEPSKIICNKGYDTEEQALIAQAQNYLEFLGVFYDEDVQEIILFGDMSDSWIVALTQKPETLFIEEKRTQIIDGVETQIIVAIHNAIYDEIYVEIAKPTCEITDVGYFQ